MNTPNDLSDTQINRLVETGELPKVDRITEMVREINPEILFSATHRRNMAYDRVPVGHDLGWRCYDGGKHDPESAFTSGEFGDGLTQNEAYVDWLRNIDDLRPATSAERELDESIDEALESGRDR